MFVFLYWSLDAPSELFEPIEHCQLKEHVDTKDDVFRFFRKPFRREEEMVEEVSEHQDGEIQSWEVVVNVGDTIHDEERNEMEEPSKERNLPNVQEVIPFARFHINVFPLLPKQGKAEEKYPDEQADSGSHPDQRCTDEVVFELVIAPTTHAESEVLERPIERLGRQDIELVWVRNQSIV